MRKYIDIITEAMKPTRADLQQRQLAQIFRQANVDLSMFNNAHEVELTKNDSINWFEIRVNYSVTELPQNSENSVTLVLLSQNLRDSFSTIMVFVTNAEELIAAEDVPDHWEISNTIELLTGFQVQDLSFEEWDLSDAAFYYANPIPQITDLLQKLKRVESSLPWMEDTSQPGNQIVKLK